MTFCDMAVWDLLVPVRYDTLDRTLRFLEMDRPISSRTKKKRRNSGTKRRANMDLTLDRPRSPVPKLRHGRM